MAVGHDVGAPVARHLHDRGDLGRITAHALPLVGLVRQLHKALLKDTVKKSPMQFSLYWKKILFSGSGTPIQIVNNEQEMIDFIIAKLEYPYLYTELL